MEHTREVEFVFEPQDEGGYHVYAREAMALYVEGLRDDGRSLDFGIIRRTLPLSA